MSSRLKSIKMLQMLQKLPIALAQVKVGNTSKNLLNKIYQVKHSLYWKREIIKKVYINKMNPVKM